MTVRTEAEKIRKFLRSYPPLAHVTADVLERHEAEFEVRIGLGRIVALYDRSSTSYQIH